MIKKVCFFFRVALQFVHDMQERAHKNFEASRDRSLPVFGVGVVFIDESAVVPIPSHEMEEAVEVVSSVVSSLAPPSKELHLVPIETVYSSDSSDGKERLIELVNAVSDPTGKEDMFICLRMLALQKVCFRVSCYYLYKKLIDIHVYVSKHVQLKFFIIVQVASEFGYNRIVLGSCISRMAAHVISATVKVCCLNSTDSRSLLGVNLESIESQVMTCNQHAKLNVPCSTELLICGFLISMF